MTVRRPLPRTVCVMGGREDDPLDSFHFDPVVLVGVWTDRTRVHRGRDQFTVDFVRHVPDPPGRVLVARTILSPVVAVDLRDQLDEAWRGYTGWPMPGAER